MSFIFLPERFSLNSPIFESSTKAVPVSVDIFLRLCSNLSNSSSDASTVFLTPVNALSKSIEVTQELGAISEKLQPEKVEEWI